MVRRIAGLPGTANDLAFSHDGERLAVLLGTGGLRLFRQKDWAEIARDETYAERGGRADFAPDGRLATTCADGKVRVYAPGLGGAVSPELTQPTSPPAYAVAWGSDNILALGARPSRRLENA